MTSWFIMAAGKATRCEGKIKQFFKIEGEPIIKRTIRLIKEVDPLPKIYVVAWRDEFKELEDVTVIDTVDATPCLAKAMEYSIPYWNDSNAILMGDVVFNKRVIETICSASLSIHVFGKCECDKHGLPERYALTFGWNDKQKIKCGLRRCVGYPLQNEVPCAVTKGLAWFIGRFHNTRGPLGTLYWKLGGVKYVADSVHMFEIHDEDVCDIDTLYELREYGRVHGCNVSY